MFTKTNYDGDIFKDAVFQGKTLDNIEFLDCEFNDCDFSETLFENCDFKNCKFINCDLSLIKVNKSTFKNIVIKNSKTIGIIWPTAAWGKKEGFQLFKAIDFIDSVLNYSSFAGLELENLQIKNCIAKEVDFSEANLTNGNFKGTDFEKSIFRKTNLEKANFIGAKNYTISPTLNKISNAKFSMPEAIALLYSMDIEIDDLAK